MQLTNFWWLLIWVFVGGFLLDHYMPKETITVMGKREQRWRLGPAIALIIPYVIWGGFRADSFGDTGGYRRMFLNLPTTFAGIIEYIADIEKDKGFYVFCYLIKKIFGNDDVVLLMALAAIQMVCLVIIFRKYSTDYWMSIFLFIASCDYMSWIHNGIRQFTAVVIIFAATDLIVKKKYIPLLGVILFASTIHASALIMIPIVIIIQGKAWNSKTILCIIVAIIILSFIDRFTDILEILIADTQYNDIVTDWQSWNDDGMSPIRVAVYAISSVLSIVGLKYIKAEDSPIINIATNAGIVSTALALIAMGTSGIYLGRLPIYVSLYSICILLPWEIENMFTENSARIVKMITIGCYVVLFYYQMHFGWGLI